MLMQVLSPAGSLLRNIRCGRAVAALVLVLVVAIPWVLLPQKSRGRRPLEKFAWMVLLSGFGVRIKTFGTPDKGFPLFAANHVSWLDVAVLGHAVDAPFIAKAEVSEWPVIGLLARRYGCKFIDRKRRSTLPKSGQVEDQFRPLILFPEGTTSAGPGVLPFRSSLFAIATDRSGGRVQPISIVYRRRDFTALTSAEMQKIAWTGDDALLPHAMALAAAGGIAVEIYFELPFSADCRKAAASRSQQAITARLDALL